MFDPSRMMRLLVLCTCLVLFVSTLASAIPKPGDEGSEKKRVHEKILSDEKHFDEHEEHNQEYDHEAFLGKDEAREFDDLSPEESKERLGKIYDKIDASKDGLVTEEELKKWIKYVQNRYVMEDTERQWKEHNEDKSDALTWESYKKRTYGYLTEEEEKEQDEGYSYKDMIRRDERRWNEADENKDGTLDKSEFANFLHPEEAEHMRGIVVNETMEDIDKNGDGLISLEEYIGDLYPDAEKDENDIPDWVKTEKDQFLNHRDTNKDGKMDRDEVSKWILPDDYDHIESEAQHLLKEADANKDGKLTKEEVVNKYDLFVGSQATDFGEALTRHDEF